VTCPGAVIRDPLGIVLLDQLLIVSCAASSIDSAKRNSTKKPRERPMSFEAPSVDESTASQQVSPSDKMNHFLL
jgi:hypothetical protein